jgi:hypothetical protein
MRQGYTGTSETIENLVLNSSFKMKELSFGCNYAEDIRLGFGTLTLMSKRKAERFFYIHAAMRHH